MELLISHPRFQKKKLSIRATSIFKSSTLFLDGIEQKKQGLKKRYLLKDDHGEEVIVDLKSFIDPIPTVILAGEVIHLVRPLTWYEYIFVALPFFLVLIGGMLGGILGFIGAVINGIIMRKHGPSIIRYGSTLLVTLVCYFMYLVLGIIIVYMVR